MATRANYPGAAGSGGATWASPGNGAYRDDGAGPLGAVAQRAATIWAEGLAALRRRPSLAIGLVAAVIGAIVGTWLASRFARRPGVEVPDQLRPTELGRAAGRGASSLAARAAGRAEDLGDRASTGSRWATRWGRRARERGAEVGATAAGRLPDTERVRDQMQAGLDLLPVTLRLLSNPIVQQYLRRTLTRQIARKLGR